MSYDILNEALIVDFLVVFCFHFFVRLLLLSPSCVCFDMVHEMCLKPEYFMSEPTKNSGSYFFFLLVGECVDAIYMRYETEELVLTANCDLYISIMGFNINPSHRNAFTTHTRAQKIATQPNKEAKRQKSSS